MKFYTHKTTSIFVIDVKFHKNPLFRLRDVNSFKLQSQISVTDTAYFVLTSSVMTGVTSVHIDKQTTCYQKRMSFNKNAES